MVRKINRFVAANGWLLLPLEIVSRLRMGIRGFIYSRSFGSAGLVLGEGPYIRGTKFISVGVKFSAGRYLWLEAIHRYGGIDYSPKIVIGNNVSLSDSVHIAATTSVTLSDGVLVGSRVLITDHNHGIYNGDQQSAPESFPSTRPLTVGQSVFIGCNVWIGDGVAILPGSNIGDGSIIGANSVVVGIIPPQCIAVGSPARPIRGYDNQSKEWKKWIPNE